MIKALMICIRMGMMTLKAIKNNIKCAIDEFTIVNFNTADCITDCQLYDELEDCETVKWLKRYIS